MKRGIDSIAALVSRGLIVDSPTIRAERSPDGRIQLFRRKPVPRATPASSSGDDGGGSGDNDAFANAIEISGSSGAIASDNTGYTTDDGHVDAIHRSAWYRWTAPADGVVTFDTLGTVFLGDGFPDTVLAAYTGSVVSALTQLDFNDDYGGFSGGNQYLSQITFTAASGTLYHICLGGYDDSEFGLFALNWSM